MNGKNKQFKKIKAFTLIELMITLSILALLVSIVSPKYFKSVDRARDQVLMQQLATMREAIENYVSDKGVYPDSLETLVKERYLKQIPVDPLTDKKNTWVFIAPASNNNAQGISDVHSGSTAKNQAGVPYNSF
ncbi:MAG: prepilin-type N-terminal cleavage/methylation domain-containing protein [Pseudomonadota bacterium]